MNKALEKLNSIKKELKSEEYYTPEYVLKALEKKLDINFKYDPATNEKQAKDLEIDNYDTIETNGLIQDWNQKARGGDIWINPPFTMKKEFIAKAVETFENGFTGRIAILVPDKSLTNKYMYDLLKSEFLSYDLVVPRGRIFFVDKDGIQTKGNFFGSVIIILSASPFHNKHIGNLIPFDMEKE